MKNFLSQDDIKSQGHAIECRIYAENPFNNFLPDTGVISYLREPGGRGVRVDSGVENGTEVSIHFDPLLAKLIVYGKNRPEAINRMKRALNNYRVEGLKTSIPFELAVMDAKEFIDGTYDTGFIENNFDFGLLNKKKEEHEEVIAAVAAFMHKQFQYENKPTNHKERGSKWKIAGRVGR